MKKLTKVALALTALVASVGVFAHMGNGYGMMGNDNGQYQSMRNSGQTPQQMQQWREHMGNNAEEHYQWMEKMHENYAKGKQVASREYCPGMMSGHMGRGMGWYNQPDNNSNNQ